MSNVILIFQRMIQLCVWGVSQQFIKESKVLMGKTKKYVEKLPKIKKQQD